MATFKGQRDLCTFALFSLWKQSWSDSTKKFFNQIVVKYQSQYIMNETNLELSLLANMLWRTDELTAAGYRIRRGWAGQFQRDNC